MENIGVEIQCDQGNTRIDGELMKDGKQHRGYWRKSKKGSDAGKDVRVQINANKTCGCPRISTLKNGSNYVMVGVNGGEKNMERRKRTDRWWYLQNMNPIFWNVGAPRSWIY